MGEEGAMTMHQRWHIFVSTLVGVGLFVSALSVGSARNLQVVPKQDEPTALKCRKVSRRFSICGDTNWKNKFVAGFGVRFRKVDPTGRLTMVGKKHPIGRDYNSCNGLMQEKAVPKRVRTTAVKHCRQMFNEHISARVKTR
jgi:hypothetical protein